jgi:hypothetical protein
MPLQVIIGLFPRFSTSRYARPPSAVPTEWPRPPNGRNPLGHLRNASMWKQFTSLCVYLNGEQPFAMRTI